MSWLARSIANSLNLDDDEDDAVPSDHHHHHRERDSLSSSAEDHHHRSSPKNIDCDEDRPNFIDCDEDRPNYIDVDEDRDQGRGVKEDLSEIKDGLTRQFWGVASFLAPPPPPPPPPPPRSQKSESESKSEFVGTDNEDEEELGEISYVSQPEDQNDDDDESIGRLVEEAVGITEEVLAFAMNIAHHPETWLDFPCSEEEEFDDFDISDAQYKHALAVEHLAPRLSALRIELCPAHMSDGYFWMVYFVLLHPRLNKHDAELLSTPQVVQARAMWMKELQNQTKEESGWLGASTFHSKDSAHSSPRDNFIVHPNEDSPSDRTSRFESTLHHMTTHHDMEHRYYEIEFVDKSVIREDPSPMLQEKEVILTPLIEKRVQQEIVACDDDDDDYWLKEDSDLVRLSNASMLVNEEDISFSDLEDDDIDCTMPIKSKIASTGWNVTAKTL